MMSYLEGRYKTKIYGLFRVSEYNQLFPPFEHGVSIDLIFNEGENASKFMKSFDIVLIE